MNPEPRDRPSFIAVVIMLTMAAPLAASGGGCAVNPQASALQRAVIANDTLATTMRALTLLRQQRKIDDATQVKISYFRIVADKFADEMSDAAAKGDVFGFDRAAAAFGQAVDELIRARIEAERKVAITPPAALPPAPGGTNR